MEMKQLSIFDRLHGIVNIQKRYLRQGFLYIGTTASPLHCYNLRLLHLPPFVKRFVDYYFGMAKHERAIGAWTQSTVQSFINFPLMQFVERVSPRPILMIAGENAHSRYFSEDVYKQAQEPKELLIVPDADHVDMYYNKEKIPFAKLKSFFEENLK